ncbi:iron uptake porin [Pleurocapsa sp. PCC 7319]|uniref:iron uptake porin n=1 Tax=Pleurocapsa sp. PCC 7319 TaxID=118161 RepID=UPI000345A81D|nr:iron uptake porin [Pleurocapsa sp. PCC 7319]
MKAKLILSGFSGLSIFFLSTSIAQAEFNGHHFHWLDSKEIAFSDGSSSIAENQNSHSNWQQSSDLSDFHFDKFENFELASKTSFSSPLATKTSGAINPSDHLTSPVLNDYQPHAGSLGEETIIPETYLVQTTNVSQMRDVAPNDWAYEALRSLVNRYSCISGFPDQTFRGNQSLSRYQFAAGLNSCLQQIERLIASQETVSQEDLQTINRLTQEFETELQAIAGRVDNLDSRLGWLEDNQFSTTTIFNGEVVFALADSFGGGPPGGCTFISEESSENVFSQDVVDCSDPRDPETNTVFAYLARLGLQSSFTGQDRLRMFLTTGNFDDGGFTNIQSLNTYMARLGYQAGLENQVVLDILEYRFPAFDDKVVFYASTFGFALSNVLTANSPYFDIGRGAVSRFGQLNPIFRIGGAMDAGVGFDWLITDPVRLQFAYGTRNSGNSEQGFFGSDHSALGVQFLVQPTENIVAGINYINSYNSDGILGTFTGSVNAETTGLWSGGRLPDQPNAQGEPSANPGFGLELGDFPAQTNAIGGSLQWRIVDNLTFGSWAAYTFTDFLREIPEFAGDTQGVAGQEPFGNTLTYLFSLGYSDPFGREGDLFAFLFGMPPKLVDAGPITRGQDVPFFEQVINNEEEEVVTDNDPRSDPRTGSDGSPRPPGSSEQFGREDEATSLHFEFFYRYTVNDHISITPGFFFVTNPGHIEDNDTLYVGTIRTTFRF